MSDFATRRSWGPKPNYPFVRASKPWRGGLITIAGPCSVESPAQIDQIARAVAKLPPGGLTLLRGGIWKAGTYPPPAKEFGLKLERLRWLRDAGRAHGLKTIAEVIDIRDLERIDRHVDAFQVGARQGQGYTLLTELARSKKPVILKRGAGMKLDEFLGAAEYLARGKCQPILVERGGASLHDHVRWDLSISMIPAIKALTGLPILVDGSHGTGRRDLVAPMTYAGLAAGADGFLVEVHPVPEKSCTDTDQAYPLSGLEQLHFRAKHINQQIGIWSSHDRGEPEIGWGDGVVHIGNRTFTWRAHNKLRGK